MNWRATLPRELFAVSAKRSLLAITLTWFCIFVLWAFCAKDQSPSVIIPAVILIGTLQYHLNILGHDGIHFLLFANRRVNDAVCKWLLHAPQGLPLHIMRQNHFYHHRHLGDPSDSDAQYYNLSRFRTRTGYIFWLVTAPVGGMTLPIARKLMSNGATMSGSHTFEHSNETLEAKKNMWREWVIVGVVQSAIFLAAYLITEKIFAYIILWLVPLVTLMTGLNSIRSCLEHASWMDSTPPQQRFLSFHSNLFERFFLAPFNMNYHAEHHLVPAVPYHQLPALRRWIAKHAATQSYEVKTSYLQQALHIFKNWRPRKCNLRRT